MLLALQFVWRCRESLLHTPSLFLDPQYPTFKLFGSYSLVRIGKFNLVFLWLIGEQVLNAPFALMQISKQVCAGRILPNRVCNF